jgi:mRNA interferase MazF
VKQFEVWWADLKSPIGRRPVILLTRTPALRYLTRCIVIEITTTMRGIPQEVELGPAEGLARRCVANLDNIHVVPLSALTERAGALEPARHAEVKRALGHALAWPELTDP